MSPNAVREDSVLLVIDIQNKLLDLVHDSHKVLDNQIIMAKVANIFGLPVLFTEQYPKGLGPTNSSLLEHLEGEGMSKLAFSGCGDPGLTEGLQTLGRKTVFVMGIETHICVMQTCLDLLEAGYKVHLVSDACASRRKLNHRLALERLQTAGAIISSVEMALFEIAERAGTPEFKAAQALIR